MAKIAFRAACRCAAGACCDALQRSGVNRTKARNRRLPICGRNEQQGQLLCVESREPNPHAELFHRHADNPILTARDWPTRSTRCSTPARVRQARKRSCSSASRIAGTFASDGRPEQRRRIGLAYRPKAEFEPDPINYSEEEWGVEDARLTWVKTAARGSCLHAFRPAGRWCRWPRRKISSPFPGLARSCPGGQGRGGLSRRFGNRYAHASPTGFHGRYGPHIWLSFSPT